MIDWLVQSSADHPGLGHAIPPAGLMSPAEYADFARLRTVKRRRDRLLGRWTGKRLLQYAVQREEGRLVSLPELEIWNSETGAPVLHCPTLGRRYSFSLSHSQDHAFCAALACAAGSVGADIEYVSARSDGFVQDYFTVDERVRVARASEAFRPTLATAVWSAKEAALKALGLGLRLDTRAIDCAIEPVEPAPQSWSPFRIRLSDGRTLSGWWRVHGNFVLTLALAET